MAATNDTPAPVSLAEALRRVGASDDLARRGAVELALLRHGIECHRVGRARVLMPADVAAALRVLRGIPNIRS